MELEVWLDEAVAGLVPRSTREAAREELKAHYEDRLEALLSTELDEETAKERAVAALGDPEQTNRLLCRVHRPWLTHLRRLVRVLLIVVLAPLLFMAADIVPAIGGRFESASRRDRYVDGTIYMPVDNVDNVDPDWVLTASRQGRCGESAEIAGREISVLAAWTMWVHPRGNEPLTQQCYLVLRIETPPWITPDPDVLERNLRVSADGGDPESSYLILQERGEDFSPYSYACWELRRNLGSCDYILRLNEPDNPDRLTLVYEGGSEAFQLTVDFGPRVEAKGGQTP